MTPGHSRARLWRPTRGCVVPRRCRLAVETHGPHFIEAERALVGRFKDPARVPEQLTLEERVGEGAAVDGDERTTPARRRGVEPMRQPFLPHPVNDRLQT